MNKSELIEAMSAQSGLTKGDAEKALNAFIDVVQNAIRDDDKVTLPGFGAFAQVQRSARVGRNPQTGAEVQIPASRSAKFTVGKKFKDTVSGR